MQFYLFVYLFLMSTKIDCHETSNESHDHLVLDLNDILRESEHHCTLLSGQTDRIFGVKQISLVRTVRLYQPLFNGTRSDGVNEVDKEDTSLE